MWDPEWMKDTLRSTTETGILYEEKHYDLVAPFQMPSFCEEFGLGERDGIRSIYELKDGRLFLKTMQVWLPDGKAYPPVCGIEAVDGYNILEKFSMFWGMEDGKVYEDIGFAVHVTGTLLVGGETEENAIMTPDFRTSNFYGWYQELLLLSFRSGNLVERRDVSGMGEKEFQEICRFAHELKKEPV